ncbi:hypothetical protein ES705_47353 [subsurface metagenome]
MDNTRKINTTITTRYDKDHQDVFKSVLDLVNRNDISKSKAQLLLVERGLIHTNNPEPLIKEVEKVVYKDRPPVEKVVYRDRPKDEHITENPTKLDGGIKTQQRPSADKLSTGDKANPHLALGEKKSANNSNIGSWVVGLSILGVIVYGLIKS